LAGLVMMAEQTIAIGICVAILLHVHRGAQSNRRRAGLAALESTRQ
jgi:hypothetical protein